jgi:polyketide biosynthesis enoyl-CoA hydratase PksI
MVGLSCADGIARVSLDDPVHANALDEETVAALRDALASAGRDPRTKVVVLLGGDDVFSHGAPRELLARLARGEASPSDILLPRALLDCPVPVIAAMAGHATGGGFALGLAADVVVLARESRYGLTFMDLGFTPGMGTTRLCEHVLSPAVAHELLYTGERRRGADLARAGGLNHVLPRAEVVPRALDIAARIADKPRPALELLKRTLSLARRRAFEESLTLESLMHLLTLPSAAGRIEAEHVG